ncbi:hypothetical protein PM082_015256 [Marasmius tenuissimus]|nr:hypothetical protein PM082_015270 [Marasmius tenuissimus]KAJ8096035.1 hypothetical protein PM082_015256 [Marasmius tenuissimus]
MDSDNNETWRWMWRRRALMGHMPGVIAIALVSYRAVAVGIFGKDGDMIWARAGKRQSYQLVPGNR